jgi:hypothetical protein
MINVVRLLFPQLLIGAVGLFGIFSVSAERLDVDYASFYSHVKKLDKEDTNKLRFAFGFMHIQRKQLCQLNSVSVVTQKQTMPLGIENGTRFTVPVDKVLKMAKAVVAIDIDDNANQCDMSVQLETLPTYLQAQYSAADLSSILTQYQAFFSNMGSFLSFMMPSAEGLVLHFDQPVSASIDTGLIDNKANTLTLDEEWFESSATSLTLSHAPIRITALVVK